MNAEWKTLALGAVLLSGVSSTQAASCLSEMSLGINSTVPVPCVVSIYSNINTSPTDIAAVEAWLEGLTPTAADTAQFIGKADATTTTGFQLLTLTGLWGKDGTWTANAATNPGWVVYAAFHFDGVPVEFHNLGALSSGDQGQWETWGADTGCTLAALADPDYTCTGGWDISNVSFWGVLEEGGDPGGGPVVPLPAAVWLFGSALLGAVGLRYRRNREV